MTKKIKTKSICALALHLILFLIVLTPFDHYAVENNFHYDKKINSINKEAVFIENKGQWADQFKYRLKKNNVNIYFENDKIIYQVINQNDLDKAHEIQHTKVKQKDHIIHGHNYYLNIVNASTNTELKAADAIEGSYNYFIGNNSEKWASNCQGYRTIVYRNIYEGIDLQFYIHSGNLKYDFIVHPNADPNQIKLNYSFVDDISMLNEDLKVSTSAGDILEKAPFAYQSDRMGNFEKINCYYNLSVNNLQFDLSEYNQNETLIIDPELVFASYSGASEDNWGYAATYDDLGNLYGVGVAFGDYPTTGGAFQIASAGNQDIAITKFNANGTVRLYSTYLGGNSNEVPMSMIVNQAGNLVVLGNSESTDFPTSTNAYGSSNSGEFDFIISTLNSEGNGILASTYVGGSAYEGLYINLNNSIDNYSDQNRSEVITDGNDNVYVCSSSNSADFPMGNNSFNTSFGGGNLVSDVVVFKMNANLEQLLYSGYIGGNEADGGFAIVLDSIENAYVVGTTRAQIPIISSSLSPNYSNLGNEGFIAQISSDGSQILATSYLPGSDLAYFVDLDSNGDVFVAGQSSINNYPVSTNVYSNPGSSTFIQKLSPDLSTSLLSTVVGNGNLSTSWVLSAFKIDMDDRINISGWGGETNTSNSPLDNMPLSNNAFQTTTDGSDFFIMALSEDATDLEYGSYFGGSQSSEHMDGGTSRFNENGVLYQAVCAGCGGNSDFPTTSGVVSATNNANNCNLGVFKINTNVNVTCNAEFAFNPVDSAYFEFNPIVTSSGFQFEWDFGDGNYSNETNPIHGFDTFGSYDVCLIVSNNNCADTICQNLSFLALDFIEYDKEISIFPNPNTGSFTVNLNENSDLEDTKIELYDASGQMVYLSKITSYQKLINLNLESGIYICTIFDSQTILYQQKIVVY